MPTRVVDLSALTSATVDDIMLIIDASDNFTSKKLKVGNLPSVKTVDSIFGRTGTVVAVSGDYSVTLVSNDTSLPGSNLGDVLNSLNNQISAANVSALTARVSSLETSVSVNSVAITSLNNTTTNLQTNINTVSASNATHTTQITALQSSVSSNNTSIATLTASVSANSTSIASLQSSVSSINSTITGIQASVSAKFDTSRFGTIGLAVASAITLTSAQTLLGITSGGGGGSTTLAALTDVALTSPIESDILTYNGSTSKWENRHTVTVSSASIVSLSASFINMPTGVGSNKIGWSGGSKIYEDSSFLIMQGQGVTALGLDGGDIWAGNSGSGQTRLLSSTISAAGTLVAGNLTATSSVSLNAVSVPSAAATSAITLYAMNVGPRTELGYRDSNNTPAYYRPKDCHKRIMFANSAGYYVGMTNSSTGTTSYPTLASTSLYTSMVRQRWTTATTSGSSAGGRTASVGDGIQIWRGNTAGAGGWYYSITFGFNTVVATQRLFTGFRNSGSVIGNVEPSSLTDMFCVGLDSTDSNLQIMTNDSSGTASKVDLGSSFAISGAGGTAIYRATFYAKPNDSVLYYMVERLDTGDVARGSVSSDLPTSTAFLFYHHWCNNGTTASSCALDLFNMYLETDY